MRGEAFRPSASLFSTRSAASELTVPNNAGVEPRDRLDNVTLIGAEGAASNDRPYSDRAASLRAEQRLAPGRALPLSRTRKASPTL
jgi:hypothetical protein